MTRVQGPGLDRLYPGVGGADLLAPRFCPLHCGAELLGGEVEHHVRKECPRRSSLCAFGCGDHVVRQDLEQHRAACPMGVLLDRADRALRESAVKELRLALDGAYRERERVHARLCARGEASFRDRATWASEECACRILNLETGKRELCTRARKRATERLTSAIANGGAERPAGAAANAPLSALRFWDALAAPVASRSARPWDMEGFALQPLLEALDEAAGCGAGEELRRRGEKMLLAGVRRLLQASLQPGQGGETSAALAEILQRARSALELVELEDIGDLPELMEDVQEEVHRAALLEVPMSSPEFYDAVGAGDVDLVRWLLDRERANPGAPDPRSRLTPLILAAKAGDLPMCELLLDAHAEVNARSEVDGLAPLHWAAHQRSARILARLLEAHANPRLQDKRGQDALMKLVRRDFSAPPAGCAWSWEVLEGQRLRGRKLPAAKGAALTSVEDATLAAEADASCVGFCVSPGDGQVVLHAAAQEGNSACEEDGAWTTYLKVAMEPADDLRLLLSASADPGAGDGGGLTALHHHLLSAPGGGSAVAVEALLRSFADVNRRDRTKRSTTPLLLAVSGKRADLVEIMLKAAWPPADVDARAPDGTSALALAEATGAHRVAKLLRDAGASAWAEAEVRLGARTTFTFDTRAAPIPS